MAVEGQKRVRPPRAAVTACVRRGVGPARGSTALHIVVKLGILDALVNVIIILSIRAALSDGSLW